MALEMVWVLTIFAMLLTPIFAEYGKIRAKAPMAFNFIFGGGVLFLLAIGFTVFGAGLFGAVGSSVVVYGGVLFNVIGWIFLLVGALQTAFKLAMDRGK